MTICVSVERSSLSLALNVLNEVLHGFSVSFSAIGTTQSDVHALFEKMNSLDKSGEHGVCAFSAEDARLLISCVALCLEEIEEGEFFTRVGVFPDVARHFVESLKQQIRERSPS